MSQPSFLAASQPPTFSARAGAGGLGARNMQPLGSQLPSFSQVREEGSI